MMASDRLRGLKAALTTFRTSDPMRKATGRDCSNSLVGNLHKTTDLQGGTLRCVGDLGHFFGNPWDVYMVYPQDFSGFEMDTNSSPTRLQFMSTNCHQQSYRTIITAINQHHFHIYINHH